MITRKAQAHASFGRLAATLLLPAALLAGAATTHAADTPPASGRFVMQPVEGGFLRMDTDNGVVSLCGRKGSDWRCETVPDDYQALQKENEALKKQLAELRKEGAGAPPAASPGKPDRRSDWPTDEEIDKGFAKLDRYLRKFKELIEKHAGPDTPGRT